MLWIKVDLNSYSGGSNANNISDGVIRQKYTSSKEKHTPYRLG